MLIANHLFVFGCHDSTDGGHPKYNIFEGESGTPLAVCVFVPLVDLCLPQPLDISMIDNKHASTSPFENPKTAAVTHGRGCTAFWPGSHRHPEARFKYLSKWSAQTFSMRVVVCILLQASSMGSVAAQVGACVSGAPMRAGDALGYDYRVVHCATPNDAEGLGADGERPVLQLTYSKLGYDPSDGNYGSECLF